MAKYPVAYFTVSNRATASDDWVPYQVAYFIVSNRATASNGWVPYQVLYPTLSYWIALQPRMATRVAVDSEILKDGYVQLVYSLWSHVCNRYGS
jgi:hypothetical protein